MQRIVGIDEVGRGAIAGPIVSAGVSLLPQESFPKGIADSKTLTDRARRALSEAIYEVASVWIGVVSNVQIDRLGIQTANVVSIDHILRRLPTESMVLSDHVGGFNTYTTSYRSPIFVVNGEDKHVEIAAASIIAKVFRDDLMIRYGDQFEGYDFDIHKGYGTAAHRSAVRRLGYSPIHRRSFRIM